MVEQRLPFYTRYVHDVSGAQRSHHVMCPRRGHAVDADDCWTCPHVHGAAYDAASGEAVLTCSSDGSDQLVLDPDRPPSRDAACVPVTQVMTRAVHCVTPDVDLVVVLDLFSDLGIGSAPVVDPAGRPVGVVTKTDLLRALRLQPAASDTAAPAASPAVEHLMTPLAFSLADHATVAQAAALMAFEQVHHAPIVSTSGVVVGVVSSLDIARFVGRASGYLRSEGDRG